ncbi:glycine zipper 2TM domain-containing protein [Marinobacterium lutimaris]|uniref:Glycine zipper 2TM domain-containing protein n=1 Tax=Marinobacterium lutimaris TaxID=568106 RepID=A0A1H6DTY5_9GAMM|nr:glycine zipper 2TM domain-containing protein [Marinobacterium lutimaris]SEG88699.1 Glycine zipper 2TM domain-containing protein [Marinobacterium lutimaris]
MKRSFNMQPFNRAGAAVGLICALTLAGCETMSRPSHSSGNYSSSSYNSNYDDSRYGYRNQNNQPTIYSGYGVVQAIELVRQGSQGDQGGVGLGAIAGAVVGGVVGHQVGKGRGNTAATIIGAVGGAYLGNELENRQQQQITEAYRVTVRMENRTTQTLLLSNNPGFRVGDRVNISNGVMERY